MTQTLANKIPPKYVIKAELCKRSLFYFVKEFWGIINTNDYVHNWHIEYICDKVQLVLDKWVLERTTEIDIDKWYKGFAKEISKNLIINVPPGTSKSTIVTRMACAWLWAVDSGKTIISNTIDSKNATEFSTSTRDIIQSEKYQLYFPHVKVRRDVSAKTFYQSYTGGRRYSLTTRGSKTGKHADVIIDDDPMDYETANSPQEAKQCIEGFKALQTRKKDKAKVPYILVMQRLSSTDTTAHALKSLDDVEHICLPAEDIHNNINPPDLRQYYVDGLLDPVRLSKSIIESQKKGLTDDSKPISDIAYNIQFNQISQSVEGLLYPKLNFVSKLPENRDNVIRLSFTDVADTGSDYFATWFVEINQGKIYIFDAIYTQEPSEKTCELYLAKCKQHGVLYNYMEANNQGSVFITLLRRLGLHVHGYTNTGNKEVRIYSYAQFTPFINFIEPNEYSSNQYRSAIKHIQAYPAQGKSEDGHDDAEDALTEVLKFIHEKYPFLLQVTN